MDTVHDTLRDCIQTGRNLEPRAEAAWLDGKYRTFMERNGYRKKQDADRELCRRIFGIGDCGIAETQKLRYWRSGRHMPNDRGVVERLGNALELAPEDQAYLMKGWFDRCDRCFSAEQTEDPLYVSRQALMQSLVDEYLLAPVKEQGNAYKVESGYITSTLTHCSIYFVSSQELLARSDNNGLSQTGQTGQTGQTRQGSPKTNDSAAVGAWAFAVLASAAAMGCLWRKRSYSAR